MKFTPRIKKYRVWNTGKKIMLNTKQGQIVINLNGTLRDSFTGHGSWNNEPEKNPKWPCMEFTGMKDKKGTDIYELDIVRVQPSEGKIYINENCIGVVIFDDGEYLVKVSDTDIRGFNTYIWDAEVLGNVFQNKNLLDKCRAASSEKDLTDLIETV